MIRGGKETEFGFGADSSRGNGTDRWMNGSDELCKNGYDSHNSILLPAGSAEVVKTASTEIFEFRITEEGKMIPEERTRAGNYFFYR
jgi:hypothetical protein